MGILRYAGGKPNMTTPTPITTFVASELDIGTTVKLMLNGSEVDFLVVNQGIPSGSSLYDASCDGTWLLMKNCYDTTKWHSKATNLYASSTFKTYLNGTFYNLFGTTEKNVIKQVKIPYVSHINRATSTISSGANGLSSYVFPLSCYEIGWTIGIYTDDDGYTEAIPVSGAKLAYFSSGNTTEANNKRIAYLNDAQYPWWLRDGLYKAGMAGVYAVSDTGAGYDYDSRIPCGVRPCIVIDSTSIFDINTLTLKEVS